MTEANWLACRSPVPLLMFIGPGVTDRKARLFQVACCRRVWHLAPSEAWCEAVTVAERYADRAAGDKKRTAAHNRLKNSDYDATDIRAIVTHHAALLATKKTIFRPRNFGFLGALGYGFGHPARGTPQWMREEEAEAHIARDIFGNPFRPVAFAPAWRTSDVMLLAQGIYDERAFDRMPILADALQDAGCDNDDILSHCRDTQLPHVRGCWVVDLVLRKE